MYIGSQSLMKDYDDYLLKKGYLIEELVDKASDCLLKHMYSYQSIHLLCGPGHNGADGLSLALKLFHQHKKVKIYVFNEIEKMSPVSQLLINQCYALNINIVLLTEENLDEMILSISKSDVIIDAIFGVGLNQPPREIYQACIEQVNQLYDQEIISVDIPTGLDCNNGTPYQSVICATQTITLSALKNGFLNPDSQFFTGKVILEELEIEDIYEEVGLYYLVDDTFVSPRIKKRRFDGHKGDYGHLGLITGSSEYKGASLLSTKSAVYTGCGIATVISCQEVLDSLTLFCPEATSVARPPIFRKEDFDKYDALLVGCGLGLSIDAYRYVIDILKLSTQPLVLDADALTILASNLELLNKQDRPIILTPHMGEFKRMCNGIETEDILKSVTQFAKEHNVILVLKGPYTLISDGMNSYRIAAGNKAMSSGGMGDVLSGIIVSLLGQGYDAIDAAIIGVYIHGYGGDLIEKDCYTVIPSRLIETIPNIMKKIMKKSNL